ncbi:MAG: class I SAM-dependent methyltransferase [Acidimicrobiia bacterium]
MNSSWLSRQNWAREAARRIPGLSGYERRLGELHARVAQLEQDKQQLHSGSPGSSSASDDAALRAEVARLQGELDRFTTLWPPGHFYSPYAPLDDVRARAREIFERDPADLPGVDLRLDEQWKRFDQLADTVDLPENQTKGYRYRFENGAYSYSDATFLHLMLRDVKPSRLIEVGSGWSSACTLDTIERHLGWSTECTFIEPYIDGLKNVLGPGDASRIRMIAEPLQNVPLQEFSKLQSGDVLFIDSTHVVRVGSDVNYLFFSVLPSLNPGVYIHFHDVFPSFEYPLVWIEEGRAWTEQYLLHGFLQYNDSFSVVLWPGLLMALDVERVYARYPHCARNQGGSIWLRKER